MVRKIENEYFVAEINDFGAELVSLKSKTTGIEYLWQGNPEYWKGRAPILFPICGRLYQGKYIYMGKEYEMTLHGIARFFEYTLTCFEKNKISLTLTANEKTKESYPFDFEFTVTYTLKETSLETEFKIKNNDNSVMPFSYGGHPGFNVPFTNEDSFEDYYVEFNENKLIRMISSDACLHTENKEDYILEDKKLCLRHDLFDNSLFFEMKDGSVRLKSNKNTTTLEVSFSDMTCLGLWHKPKSDAPYVCIEPWHGVPADDGKIDDLSTKRQMILLNSNEEYIGAYSIKITE